MEEQERIWFAREVFQLFVKCFTNLKLYPHHHVHVREANEAFAGRLRSYVAMHDVLRFTVTQAALVMGDETVYEEENRNENLAFRLYVDGLREISIQRGVSKEEAIKLAMVFYKAIVDPMVDATLLMWEAEFNFIDYAAINSLSEAWDQPDFLSNDALGLLRDMNTSVDALVSDMTSGTTSGGKYDFEVSDAADEFEEMQQLADKAEGEGPDEQSGDDDIYEVGDEALHAFRQTVQSWGPDGLLKSLVEASLDGLALQADLVGIENVDWLLKESVEMALRTEDMELLGMLLTRYEGELGLVEEDEEEALFEGVFTWLGREENINRLVDMAKGEAVGGPAAFCRILGLLGDAGVNAAVATFIDAPNNKQLREALLKFLEANLARQPRALGPLVEPQQEPEVVQAGLFLLSKQRGLSTDVLEDLLNSGRQHPDAKIKEYATHLWRTMTTEGVIKTNIDALAADSRRDRQRAIELLVEGKHNQALEPLMKVVESKAFMAWETRDERKEYLQAIRVLGGMRSVAFLQRQAQRSAGLLKRGLTKEIRELADEQLKALKKSRS